jgi:hypothetical protein
MHGFSAALCTTATLALKLGKDLAQLHLGKVLKNLTRFLKTASRTLPKNRPGV